MNSQILFKNTLINSFILLIFRIASLLLSIILINNLNIEDFANFQLIKNAIGYLLVAMEFGFFHFNNTLYNNEKYNFKSIFFNFIKLRLTVFTIIFPFILFYFYLNEFTNVIIIFSTLLCILLIFSYEGSLVSISKNLELNLILLTKTLCFLILIIIFKEELNLNDVLNFFIYSYILGIVLQYSIYLTFKDKNKKILKKKIYQFALKAKNYFIINISNHVTIYMGLTASPFIISKSDVGNYAILLLVLEVLMIPLYQIQKIIMPSYSKKKDNKVIFNSIIFFILALFVGMLVHKLFGNYFFQILLSDEYSIQQIIKYVYLLFPIAFLRGVTTMLNLYYFNNNLILFQRNISLITALISFFIFLTMGNLFGLLGFILGLLIVEFFYIILSSKKIFNILKNNTSFGIF
tara:strand:+ start:157 stop:1374 length:1218 start_codon:yes stop_codon:yes gene_type:complete